MFFATAVGSFAFSAPSNISKGIDEAPLFAAIRGPFVTLPTFDKGPATTVVLAFDLLATFVFECFIFTSFLFTFTPGAFIFLKGSVAVFKTRFFCPVVKLSEPPSPDSFSPVLSSLSNASDTILCNSLFLSWDFLPSSAFNVADPTFTVICFDF